jgi:hypothetical protein
VERLRVGLKRWLGPAPSYPPSPGDIRTVTLLGLELPLRATITVLVVVTVVCLDWSRTFIPPDILALQRAAPAERYQALERVVLFGLLPLVVVVALFRDRATRYGLGLGVWRVGLPIALAGVGVMAPVVLWLATRPEFAAYYGPSRRSAMSS